jgi:hypothetical protein
MKSLSVLHKSLLFIFLFVLGVNFYHHRWTRQDKVIEWDSKHYYGYLPATFIYKDISLNFLDTTKSQVARDNVWYERTKEGKRVFKMSMGVSYAFAPFFALGNLSSWLAGKELDGYNSAYKIWLVFGSLFYLILGLYFLSKVLIRYFDQKAVGITLMAISLGTNLLYYSTFESSMSHVFSFSLIAIIIYHISEWHEKRSWYRAIIIGLLTGWICLIRPTNLVVVFILILWNVGSINDLKQRFISIFQNFGKYMCMAFFSILAWIPQLLYWKKVTGYWFYNPYELNNERFFFLSPNISDILFSYQKGWFIYMPLMFIACFGFILLYKRHRKLFTPLFVSFFVSLWLIASWWSWWYGGSFGGRAFIDWYAVMAFPLAAIVTYAVHHSQSKVRKVSIGIGLVLILFNFWQTERYTRGSIHHNAMNKKVYWGMFLKLNMDDHYWQHMTEPDYKLAAKGIYVWQKYPQFRNGIESVGDLMEQTLNDSLLMNQLKQEAFISGISLDSVRYKYCKQKFKEMD